MAKGWRRPYDRSVTARAQRPANFADASFEPSDEQLAELMTEAFAQVAADSEAALARFHEEIERLRKEAIRRARELASRP